MTDRFTSRGFFGRRRDAGSERADRIPPGQYLTDGFPVLSAGPTPQVPLDRWEFTIDGLVSEPVRWSWEQFQALPSRDWTVDISCVTKWTKLDTVWHGVSVDDLLAAVEVDPKARFVTAHSFGGYTTNLPLTDLVNNQAFVAYLYDGAPLESAHGGPARLVVPHLYFWKSAKWVRGMHLIENDQPGFWESLGYHNRGDPWREERYSGD
ncbi:MAG TPA: sulfite oxidase-like oxidoreductase [Candidatus Saccharimonadales bacterium]|nr:sulfite oxidase-like oxidoreductase [Candidatus Saccharimonadales bacterium]